MSFEVALRQIAAEQRLLADRLDQLIADANDESSWPVFDPASDEPPVHPDIAGNRIQLDWVALLLWSKLAALNVREHRGADRGEYIQLSKDAGYRDGRGWNAWDGYDDLSDGRWINSTGMNHLRVYYGKQRRTLPTDIAAWADAGCTPE